MARPGRPPGERERHLADGPGQPVSRLAHRSAGKRGACTLVWNRGFELHVCLELPQAEAAPGTVQAAVDLGEIHLAAVTTTTGKALIVTGRGIRSLKRQRNRQLGQLAKKQSRCTETFTSLEEVAACEEQGMQKSRSGASAILGTRPPGR